jgi:hypothetical protein
MRTFHAPVADAHKPLWDDNVAVGLRSHFLRTETLPALARCPLSIRGLLKFATAATGRDVPIPDACTAAKAAARRLPAKPAPCLCRALTSQGGRPAAGCRSARKKLRRVGNRIDSRALRGAECGVSGMPRSTSGTWMDWESKRKVAWRTLRFPTTGTSLRLSRTSSDAEPRLRCAGSLLAPEKSIPSHRPKGTLRSRGRFMSARGQSRRSDVSNKRFVLPFRRLEFSANARDVPSRRIVSARC